MTSFSKCFLRNDAGVREFPPSDSTNDPLTAPDPKRKTGVLIAIASLLMACGQPAHGFDSNEHTLLGDTAIKVVAEEYGCVGREPFPTGRDAICKVLTKIGNSSPNYGDIVAYVDGFLTPEKLMAVCAESAGEHLLSTATNGFPAAWPTTDCGASRNTYLQATHSNHAHFQSELLISLNTYHSLAMSLAREHSLEGALLVNAIGDHYLHDFFAPGHITVFRYKTTDLFSNALHDAANRRGADFHLGGTGLTELSNEAVAIRNLANMGHPETKASLDAFPFAGSCKSFDSNFRSGDTVNIKGDGYLERSDGCRQSLLMLAANVVSIKNVLNAYEQKETRNSFEPHQWQTSQHKPTLWIFPEEQDIEASLPFGHYVLGDAATTENDKTLPLAYDPVFGINVAKELFNANQRIARTSWSIETVPFASVAGGIFQDRGVAMGYYHYEGDGGVTGNGGSLRFGFIIPQTESTLSIGVRRVHHSGTLQDGWRNGYSLRFDQGYSSFFSLFISIGKDYSAQPHGPLAQGSFLSAGIMLAAPGGRIWKCVSHLGECVGR